MISVITESEVCNLLIHTKYHGLDRYLTEILFCGERLTFLSRESIPGGLLMRGITCASLHVHF